MKILILGGTGAMGVPLVKLLADNNDIYVTTRAERISSSPNIKYIRGDAHELDFIQKLLDVRYDVVIDFMVYTTEQFRNRAELFLKSTSHYVFFSSARVYANDSNMLTESSSRLLDVCNDSNYLHTKEYALEKARQENLIIQSHFDNWTIIRPYITYNYNRFQLGWWEKEVWLYRFLNGKSVVFFNDIASKYTTMTFGDDVAKGIAKIINSKNSFSKVIHITSSESLKWKDILDIYSDVLFKLTGEKIKIVYIDRSDELSRKFGTYYQVKYDRDYNRIFDDSKFSSLFGRDKYVGLREGIEKCMKQFLENNQSFISVDWIREGMLDRITGDKTKFFSIPGLKNKLRYYCSKFIPSVIFPIIERHNEDNLKM